MINFVLNLIRFTIEIPLVFGLILVYAISMTVFALAAGIFQTLTLGLSFIIGKKK